MNEAEASVTCPKQTAKKIKNLEDISKLFNGPCMRQIQYAEQATNGEVRPVNAEQPDHEDADVPRAQPLV